MSHSWYACNIDNRTCFELGSHWLVDSGISEITQYVVDGDLSFEEFKDISAGYYTENGIREHDILSLFEYLVKIEPENYKCVYHEDELCEGVFGLYDINIPLVQVNSVYSNCGVWVYGSHIVKDIYRKKLASEKYEYHECGGRVERDVCNDCGNFYNIPIVCTELTKRVRRDKDE